MAEVSLSDHYVLLLTQVVDENKALRSQLAENHKDDQQSMKSLSDKVEALTSKVASTSAARVRLTGGGTLRVPKLCSNDARRHLTKLAKAGENTTLKTQESDDSDHNLCIFNLMKDQLYHEYQGVDKCPWNVVQLKAAYKTYMKSKRAYAKRCSKGANQGHITSCRRQNRKREKLGRRLKSLVSKENWSDSKKAEVADVMRIDYMSSEESDLEEDGTSRAYRTKPLLWESAELKKKKKSLDRFHLASLPTLVRQRVVPRRQGPPSIRQKPNSCPDWACQ